ncbi:hypothetical protein [Prauserella cavernicola]|nr:hypothetical protein [Prauserella cavernicola]
MESTTAPEREQRTDERPPATPVVIVALDDEDEPTIVRGRE